MGLEKYWEQNGVSGSDKEQWSRMKCGNVGRGGTRGIKTKSVDCADRKTRRPIILEIVECLKKL